MTLFAYRPGPMSGNRLLLLAVGFIVLTANYSFFARIAAAYPVDAGNVAALSTLPLALAAATLLLLAPFALGPLVRPVTALAVLVAAANAHFMDSYGVAIDDDMLRNLLQTNPAEAGDLVTMRLALRLLLLGVLPSWLILRVPVIWRGWRRELTSRATLLAAAVGTLVAIGLGFGNFHASFIREHKEIRSYANPTYIVYSAIKLMRAEFADVAGPPEPVGTDAQRPAEDRHRELVILVVGETARADRFGLNGYPRDTTPRLSREAVVSFTDVSACGTSTATSVPCMFSNLGHANFSPSAASRRENVLDVISRTGAYVLWIDNNSDSKGVAARIPYANYRSPDANPRCDDECRDEGMLINLRSIIDARTEQDIVIVLHQMGNHGPAYYKRYPRAFEKFQPACHDADLSHCTDAEIGNAYDNAILYTDHFLAEAISLLKSYDDRFETALFYISDHGESLGEKGIYLHGMPRAVAPSQQMQVPALIWFGAGFDDVDLDALRRQRERPLTHDNLFHTLLGFLEIRSHAYRSDLDILTMARPVTAGSQQR